MDSASIRFKNCSVAFALGAGSEGFALVVRHSGHFRTL